MIFLSGVADEKSSRPLVPNDTHLYVVELETASWLAKSIDKQPY